MPNLIQYELDPKGSSANNLVSGELHPLTPSRKIRAIAPLQGAFFTNSVKIKKAGTDEYLLPILDFVFTEIYQSLTIKYSKEIAGIILITNETIEGDLELEYQVLGSYFNEPASQIADLINNKNEHAIGLERWSDLNIPTTFLPSPYIHELGTDYGFEYVNYALERIRSSIMGSDIQSYDFILSYIKEFASNIVSLIDNEIDGPMRPQLDAFTKQFTKELAKLEKVVNIPAATEADGRVYATQQWQYKQQSDNKYIITSALMGFKEALYNYFVSTAATAIGSFKGILATPQIVTMINMVNGARYVFDTLENIQLAKIPYDLKAYPDVTISDSKWIVHKLVNNVENRGGIFAAYSLKTSEFYTGILKTTITNEHTLTWIKHITRVDSDRYIQTLVDHMENTHNPHETTKFHTGLGEVENLSVVTREDILCRKPVRKYVTYDALLLFWKIFLKDVKQLGDNVSEEDKLDVAERFRLIFAPCGPCGTQPYTPPPPTPAPPPPVDPRDKLLGVWCVKYDKYGRFSDGFGGSYEKLIEKKSVDCRYKNDPNFKERGTLLSSYCEGTTLYGRYADGKNSFYIATIEEASSQCGGIATTGYTLIEIRNKDNTLFGYGYITTSQPADPDATVMLTDQDGEGICYIFPTPKPQTVNGHEATVELRDTDDQIIGYAIKP